MKKHLFAKNISRKKFLQKLRHQVVEAEAMKVGAEAETIHRLALRIPS